MFSMGNKLRFVCFRLYCFFLCSYCTILSYCTRRISHYYFRSSHGEFPFSCCPGTGLIFTGLQEAAQPGELIPPGQTELGILYHVPLSWVPVGGSWEAGTHSRLGRAQRRCGLRERLSSAGLFCVFPFSVSLLLLFPFVCCSVKLPLSRPTGFCLFPFSSAPRRGEGRPRGAFVAGCSRNQNTCKAAPFRDPQP